MAYSSRFYEFVKMLERRNFVVLDTETTGLYFPAEIIEIAVIDPDRKVLLNQFVRPVRSIPEEATAIHGITDTDVEHALTWQAIRSNLVPLLQGKDLIIYNADYDISMLRNSDRVNELSPVNYGNMFSPWCAMLWFAEWWGDWSDYRNSYRWQKLTTACQSLAISTEGAHGALGDCMMTIKLIEATIAELKDIGDLSE